MHISPNLPWQTSLTRTLFVKCSANKLEKWCLALHRVDSIMPVDLFWFYSHRWKGGSDNNCFFSLCVFYLKARRTRVCGWESHDLGEAFRVQQTGPDIWLYQLTNAPFLVSYLECQLPKERTWGWSLRYAAKVLLTSAAGLLENNNPAALIGRGVTESRTDEAAQWSSKLKHSEQWTAIILWLQGNVCFTGHNEQAAAARAHNSAVPDELVYSLARERTEKRGISLKTSIYAHWLRL